MWSGAVIQAATWPMSWTRTPSSSHMTDSTFTGMPHRFRNEPAPAGGKSGTPAEPSPGLQASWEGRAVPGQATGLRRHAWGHPQNACPSLCRCCGLVLEHLQPQATAMPELGRGRCLLALSRTSSSLLHSMLPGRASRGAAVGRITIDKQKFGRNAYNDLYHWTARYSYLEKLIAEGREDYHIVYIDPDVLVLRDLHEVFEREFDYTVTISENDEQPINGAMHFVPKGKYQEVCTRRRPTDTTAPSCSVLLWLL